MKGMRGILAGRPSDRPFGLVVGWTAATDHLTDEEDARLRPHLEARRRALEAERDSDLAVAGFHRRTETSGVVSTETYTEGTVQMTMRQVNELTSKFRDMAFVDGAMKAAEEKRRRKNARRLGLRREIAGGGRC